MSDTHRHTILFLAANPGAMPPRALDREARAIAGELASSGHRDRFDFKTRWATTPLDLLRALRRAKPTVVHISTHGGGGPEGVMLHGDEGAAQLVSPAALTQLFAAVGGQVRLIVLDACYSAPIADALLAHCDCIVGVNGALGDVAARAFAIGFYGALGDGESVAAAFVQGEAAIALTGAAPLPGSMRPVLCVRPEVDAAQLMLANLEPVPRGSPRDEIYVYLRLTAHLLGVRGFVCGCAMLIVGAALGLRTWFAFGESDLGLRVQQLTVQAADLPQPVQDSAAVREMTASAAALESGPPGLPAGEHRIALRGAFAEIDLAGRSAADPHCRLHLAAERGRVAIDRATRAGAPCDHRVLVVADAAGLVLTVDEGPPAAIAPGASLVLRLVDGTAVRLAAGDGRLSLFQLADNVVWAATAVEARAAAGERVRLPGGLRSSDSVALTGAIALRELALDGDRLVVAGTLRGWHGSTGRKGDWDASAPWPRAWAVLCAVPALVVLALAVVMRVRVRWRAMRGRARIRQSRFAWLVCFAMALIAADSGTSGAAPAPAAAPTGEIWMIASPAVCQGVERPLGDYEQPIAERASATMATLGRQPRWFTTRAALLDALAHRTAGGWLLLFISGHGSASTGSSRVCIGDGTGPGDWLDIDDELLPALPPALGGAVIVLDSCSSAHVDPRRARIPTAILSASPYAIEPGALFGATVLDALAAASDDNCNGVFDDDDLFAGLARRLAGQPSLVAFEAWPKLRRNAPSPVPVAVRAQSPNRCAAMVATAEAVPASDLPEALVAQRRAQAAQAAGQAMLPALGHDFFVVAPGADPRDAAGLRTAARAAGLEELGRISPSAAAALAGTMAFAEIYRLELSFGWLRTWRLRDGLLVSVVPLAKAACGIPSRTAVSGADLEIPGLTPRYSQADRYLREVSGTPSGPATACFESEGQCFVAPASRLTKGCDP
jgi:hypothetical protein